MPKAKNMHETDKDAKSEVFISGRHQEIPANPAKEFKRTTLAAGAVLWRGNPQDPEVAVIHRPHYDDWSLPKGKVDPGESLPTTAAREILEETGYDVKLDKLIGKVTYPVQGRTKVVYYWLAQYLKGSFEDNSETDELRWLPINEACELLTYDVDTDVLAKAKKRLRLAPTTRVLYVRHARAHQRRNWEGDDNLRPLDKKGRRQAEMLVPMLSPYHPTAIYSASPQRCQQTAAPLADELGLDIAVNKDFGDEGWQKSPAAAEQAFQRVVAKGGVPVIVSQGETIPGILESLKPQFLKTDFEDLRFKKGSVWVLSFNNGVLTGADYLASALPVR
ncbi:bifunctional NUDIX hydrolase/histidine phosphatase family protein [Corynebacterium simulans]|uniref:bifunctional NUDIX hydrolase/histidine phosphatase family protein n=1 Tax=Corynebacterium simulans TaxID=146827 RepID=UPI002550EB6F|nr:bifunctional NUDIX hydrolase/histidine phosphatase family protein [Corynebacterium simulans]MDK7138555.1 bifunctional NUDIX hydrolase/histidine phosphatase family protein [Corynebacterium simulans]